MLAESFWTSARRRSSIAVLVGARRVLARVVPAGDRGARAKADREVAARMQAVIKPGQQQEGRARRRRSTGWIPDKRDTVRQAVRRGPRVSRAARHGARGGRGQPPFRRVRRGDRRGRDRRAPSSARAAPANLLLALVVGGRRRRRADDRSSVRALPGAPRSSASSSRTCLRSWRPRSAQVTASCSRSTRSRRRSRSRRRPSSSGSSPRSGSAARPRTRWSRWPNGSAAPTSSGPCSPSTSSERSAGTSRRSSTTSPIRCASGR